MVARIIIALVALAIAALIIVGLVRDRGPSVTLPVAPDPSVATVLVPPLPDDLAGVPVAVADLIREYHQAVLAAPRDAGAWLTLGNVYDANGELLLAGQCYDQAFALDETCARCRFYRAMVRFRIGEYAPAIDDMRVATTLAPDYAPAHWRLGLWLTERGDLEEAASALLTATRLEPREAAAWVGLAAVRMHQQRLDDALTILTELLTWMPSNRSHANQLLGMVYQRMGRREDAERAMRASDDVPAKWADAWMIELAQYNRSAMGGNNIWQDAAAAGRIDDAILAIQRMLATDPGNSVLLNNLGALHRRAGRIEESIDALNRALAADEHNESAHFNLAFTYLIVHQETTDERQSRLALERARLSLDALQELNPSFEGAYGIRGFIREQDGDIEGAIEAYRLAARVVEGSEPWLDRLSVLLLTAGRWAEAADVLEQLTYRYQPQPKYVYQQAVAHLNAGQLEVALATINRFTEQWPENSQVAQLRANIQQRIAQRDAGVRPNP